MAQECSSREVELRELWGARGDFLQRRAEERRERKCWRKKKGTLNRGAAKRRTVGWKKCAADDVHVEQG
jgi:hypothetical protein